jgi:hypothetical protein
MVDFDVVSVFSIVPITDMLQLLSQQPEECLLPLFKHVLTCTYFCFEGQFYEQTNGMATSLPPFVANYFMEDFEKRAIEQATHKAAFWFRYVDETSVIWPHVQENLQNSSTISMECVTTYSSG